jgi:hypothetical protein
MNEKTQLAISATRRLRDSAAFRGLSGQERDRIGADLDRIERALGGSHERPAPAPRYGDPYAIAQATPADLQRDLAGPGRSQSPATRPGSAPAAAAPAAPARKTPFEQFAATGDAVDAINFPGFVASLIQGTFQAIVDATAQQLREYADLVGNLSRSVDDFARDHVSNDQVRASLAKHKELRHVAPPPGTNAETSLAIAPDAEGSSPGWLADYGLEGEELTPELIAGPLLDAGRTALAEQRMSTLASMVLMGINRIVVSDGDIRAKLQFFANVREKTDAELATTQVGQGIAGRSQAPAASLMVATVKANTQAEASLKANLTGEVRIAFRTETFPLERFADSQAIQLLNRHAKWKGDVANAPAAAAAPGAPAATPPREGGT